MREQQPNNMEDDVRSDTIHVGDAVLSEAGHFTMRQI